jgi:hypothetical protein
MSMQGNPLGDQGSGDRRSSPVLLEKIRGREKLMFLGKRG